MTRCIYLFVLLAVGGVAQSETLDGTIVRVADGDSLTLQVTKLRMRVRLIEIDAPELKQAFGIQSRQSLTELCLHKPARVTWAQKDRFGRRLARVWCSGIDANAEQVRRGMAWVFDRYATDPALYGIQQNAKAARIGLWVDSRAIAPWDWRRTRGVSEAENRKR